MADRFPALQPEEWKSYLEGGHPNAAKAKSMRKVFARIPSPPRCRHCLAPFAGPFKPILPLLGKQPATKNPTYCEQCFGWLTRSRGGAEVELSMFFADVRGSTPLSERLGPSAFARLMSRFYATGVDILARSDALIERFMGDRVVGYYFPGFAGPHHARRAIDAGLELLRATGNTAGHGPWIPVGIGVHTGVAYVGTVGDEMLEFTALGDEVVIPARLSDLAGAGEMLVTRAAYAAAGLDGETEVRDIALKGIASPAAVRVLRAA